MNYREVEAIAAQQHGLVTRAQIVDLLGDWGLQVAVKKHVVARIGTSHSGVYRLTGAATTWEQTLCAATLQTGGFASHKSAARLWGMRFLTSAIEVTVVRRSSQPQEFTVHESEQLDGWTQSHNNIAVTAPARTLIDLSGVVGIDRLEKALDRSLADNIVTLAEIRDCRDQMVTKGRKRVTALDALIESRGVADERSETDWEIEVLRWIREAGLPEPKAQHWVRQGKSRYRFDFVYLLQKVAVEPDGRDHLTVSQVRADKQRDSDTAALGWLTLRAQKGCDRARFIDNLRRILKTRTPPEQPATPQDRSA